MNEPPDQTEEFRAANLLSFRGNYLAEVLLHQLWILTKRGIHVTEDHAHALKILAVSVEHHLRFILRGYSR